MDKNIFIMGAGLLLATLCTKAHGQGMDINNTNVATLSPKVINQNGAILVRLNDYQMSKHSVIPYLSEWLGLNKSFSFQQFNEREDEQGFVHTSLQQYYKGYKVNNQSVMIHSKDEIAKSITGQIAQFEDFTPCIALNVTTAEELAKKYLNVESLIAQYPVDTVIVKRIEGADNQYVTAFKITIDACLPQRIFCDLYVDAISGAIINNVSRIADADLGGSGATYFSGTKSLTFDAGPFWDYNSNSWRQYRLLDNARGIHTYDATNALYSMSPSTGWTDAQEVYTDTTFLESDNRLQTIVLTALDTLFWKDSLTETFCRLQLRILDADGREVIKKSYMPVYSYSYPYVWSNLNVLLHNKPYRAEISEYFDGVLFSFPINNTLDTNQLDTLNSSVYYVITPCGNPIADIHWGMEQTYDYYITHLNRNSYDGYGGTTLQFYNPPGLQPEYDNTPNNAYATTAPYHQLSYGRGDGTSANPFVHIETIGHEFTHLVTSYNGNGGLEYQGESGALNESFSDIFGTCVDFYYGDAPNWEIGENEMFSGAFRSMSNPKAYGHPDTYQGNYWINTSSTYDNGGVHANSGVQNYWFYLLCNGGSGVNDKGKSYNVVGIGMEKAMNIAYINLIYNLSSGAGYSGAYLGSMWAAEALYGDSSQAYSSTFEAWYAVGVAEINETFCSGTTTLTAQSGTFGDGSGASKNYGNNSDCVWTIAPPNAKQVFLKFTEFNTEQYRDYVYIYNGANTYSPQIGAYTGTQLPDLISSTYGVGTLTVRFVSDESNTAAGWSANYYTDSTLSLGKSLSDMISIYPNPTMNQITIEGVENYNLFIYNPLGELILQTSSSQSQTTIDVSHLAAGLYILKINKDAAIAVEKIKIIK